MLEILSNAEAQSISRRLAEKTAIWNSAPTRGTSHLEDFKRRFCGGLEGEEHPRLVDAHFAQLNTQLRFSPFEVGLLLNFRQGPLKEGGIRRVIHTKV